MPNKRRLVCPECQEELEEIGNGTVKCQQCKWVGLSDEVKEGQPDFTTWKRRSIIGGAIVTMGLLVAIYYLDLAGQAAAVWECSDDATCEFFKAAGPILALVGKVVFAIVIALTWLGLWAMYGQKKKLESQR